MNFNIINNVNGIPIIPTGSDIIPACSGNGTQFSGVIVTTKDPLLSNEVTVMTVPVVE